MNVNRRGFLVGAAAMMISPILPKHQKEVTEVVDIPISEIWNAQNNYVNQHISIDCYIEGAWKYPNTDKVLITNLADKGRYIRFV